MNKWWKNACVYQIYPASFNDSKGTGMGDIRGITERLDYLSELGIGVIWLSPVYASPMADNGYDISDYYAINPLFGTMADMDELIEKADAHGIKIIMDLVVNHTSDMHAWFQSALKDKHSPYRDYYIWRDNSGTYPNDMQSVFGGPAWTLSPDKDEYYFHLFTKEQPDLNWDNEKMRREIYEMMNWWIDKGIAGFRMDVIDLIGKIPDEKITENGPMLHPYIKEMNQATLKGRHTLTVGECWGASPEDAKKFSDPDDSELSMVFQFHHLLSRWGSEGKWNAGPVNLNALKEVFETWQLALNGKGWNSLFWGNHDLPRAVSFWGNDMRYRVESAKMLATLLHGLQGTPYIYQGEELGMTNVHFKTLEEYRDVETLNFYHMNRAAGKTHAETMAAIEPVSRDNARTPMQWSSAAYAGFSDVEPWIGLNPNYTSINAAAQVNDPKSVFTYYKELIALRRSLPVITHGNFNMVFKDHPQIFAYTRNHENDRLTCICNYSEMPAVIQIHDLPMEIEEKNILIHNYDRLELSSDALHLKPYEAMLLLES